MGITLTSKRTVCRVKYVFALFVCLQQRKKFSAGEFLILECEQFKDQISEIQVSQSERKIRQTKIAMSSKNGQHRNEFIALMAVYLLALTSLSTSVSCLILGLIWLVTGNAIQSILFHGQ